MKSLIFLTAMICGLVTFAGDIDINGDFKKLKGKMPVGWRQNTGAWAKPMAEIEILKSDKGNALKVSSSKETKASHVYSTKIIPVKKGDKVKLTVKMKGKGKAGIGIYVNGAKKWCFGSYKTIKLTEKLSKFTNIVTIRDRVKKGKVEVVATLCKVVLESKADTEVTYESVTVEVIPTK